MKHQYPLALLLLLALTLPIHSQICSLSSSTGDLLQSGQHIIYNSYNPQGREHRYDFTVNFAVPSNGLQVAACNYSFIQQPQASQLRQITVLILSYGAVQDQHQTLEEYTTSETKTAHGKALKYTIWQVQEAISCLEHFQRVHISSNPPPHPLLSIIHTQFQDGHLNPLVLLSLLR